MSSAPVQLRMFASTDLFMTGLAVGLSELEGLMFDKDKAFTGCRICGAIFQSDADRTTPDDDDIQLALNTNVRKAWSHKHAKQHKQREHVALAMSGNWCTPEAASKFAAFGIVPITDLVMSEEVAAALATAPSKPQDDVEG